MSASDKVVLFVFFVFLIHISYKAWVAPVAFLRSAKYFRIQLNRLSFGIFMPDHVIKMIDENPRFQIWFVRIWFVRIGYPFILTFIACVFSFPP